MTHDDFMYLFTHYWWVIIPLIWFIYAAYCSSLRYAHRRDKLSLLRTYVDQGKDVPPELAKALGNGDSHPFGDMDWSRYAWRYSPYRQSRRFVFALALAAGFGIAYYNNPTNEAFEIVAVIFAVLAAGSLIIMLTFHDSDGK
jgi:hypothetical protein